MAEATMTARTDVPPPVAVGHVHLWVNDVAESGQYFIKLGLRAVHIGAEVAVLELAGGTHLVVLPAQEPVARGAPCPFDLMVSDLAASHDAYAAMGAAPSPIAHGRIHSGFTLVEPSGYTIEVVSSHTGSRVV